MSKNYQKRVAEMHSVIDDIFIEASRGKLSWEDAYIQICNEIYEDDNINHEEVLNFHYKELKSHIGHKIVCTHYANYQNIAVECETCNTVLLDYDKPEGSTDEELQDKKDEPV